MKNSEINTNTLFQKHTLTQLLAGCLFVIFIINTIFSFFFFEVKRVIVRYEIKHKILQQLTDNQLVVFSKSEHLDENEFEFKGTMYDVVRQETINGKVVLLCFEDKKETQLNHSIEALIKKDLANSPIKNTQQKLIVFLKLPLIPFQNFTFCFLKKPTSQQFISLCQIIFSSFINVLSAPPDFK